MTRASAEASAHDWAARLAAYAWFAIQGLCFAVLVTRVPQIQRAHHLSDGTLAIVLLLVPVIAGVGSVLPGWVHVAAQVNPLLHCVELVRHAVFGFHPLADLGPFAALLAFTALM